jgi:hypothetical protein
VVTADRRKFVFENRGDVQTVYDEDGRPISVSAWTDSGPESLANAQLAYLGPAIRAGTAIGRVIARKAAEAATLLFTWLSRWNGPDGIAVMSFPAYVFERGKAESDAAAKSEAAPISVRRVTEKELTDACKKYRTVQNFVNKRAAEVKQEREDWSAQGFGTEVHKRVACDVNGFDKVLENAEPPGMLKIRTSLRSFRCSRRSMPIRTQRYLLPIHSTSFRNTVSAARSAWTLSRD